MKALSYLYNQSKFSTSHAKAPRAGTWKMISWDGAILLAMVAGLNMHLAGIGSASEMIFLPGAFAEGQWWRLLTYPFVHVSWYHLFLDAGAFFLLYAELADRKISHKLFCLMCCTAVSLIVALLASPLIESRGLGGLSGTAHGLMAFYGLEMMGRKSERRIGQITFWLVAAKSVWEAINGQVFLGFMHMGSCGTPLAACHLGGVLGGILAYWLLKERNNLQNAPDE